MVEVRLGILDEHVQHLFAVSNTVTWNMLPGMCKHVMVGLLGVIQSRVHVLVTLLP